MHLILSIIKSSVRIGGAGVAILLPLLGSPLVSALFALSVGILLAELIGIAEELI
jgi:hypothetical protein